MLEMQKLHLRPEQCGKASISSHHHDEKDPTPSYEVN